MPASPQAAFVEPDKGTCEDCVIARGMRGALATALRVTGVWLDELRGRASSWRCCVD